MNDLSSFIRDEHRTWDTGTFHEVVTHDCYHIASREFTPSDIIIDVGANIGFFSGLAIERGAGLVVAVEASPMNFARLKQNLSPYGSRVEFHCRAVWRSDQPQMVLHLNESRADGNTGGINVVEDKGEVTVETVALDDLIGERDIRFIKIDCEGSEFPILYTSKRLHRAKEIVIEVHPIDHLLRPEFNVRPGQNNPGALAEYLRGLGFIVHNDPRKDLSDGWAYLTAFQPE